jgi:hypothetical protein
LVTLVVTATRLMTRSTQLIRTLFVGTTLAAIGAGLAVTVMVLNESGDGWQLFAVLVVLALLGQALTPILQRYTLAPVDESPSERILGEIAGAVVVAVRTERAGRRIHVGDREISVAEDELIVVRRA